jgi:hypothetical protein
MVQELEKDGVCAALRHEPEFPRLARPQAGQKELGRAWFR